MPTPSDPPGVDAETTLTGLTADGSLPAALIGRCVRIGAHATSASVHALDLDSDGVVAYRSRRLMTDALAANVVAFAGRTLALCPGALAFELDEHLATLGRVDLAGHGRGIGAHPQLDPHTGALHVVSFGDEPAHHVVAPNSQTRITVPVPDAPGPLHDLLLTRDRFVLLGAGFVGVTERSGEGPARWVEVEIAGPIAAHDLGGDVAVLTAGRSLVRWTLDGAAARSEVLDGTPQRFGTTNPQHVSVPTYVWTVAAAGGTEVYRHDLRTGQRAAHDLGPDRHPGAMTFVPDPVRLRREDGGWLMGLVHDDATGEADLVVLDAAAIERPPVASVRIPRCIPDGLHGTWIPAV